MGIKVLVTGASGFIGNYVVGELIHRGVVVVATSSSAVKASAQNWFPHAGYIPFDIKSDFSGQNLFEYFGRPDALIHLAWEGLPNYKQLFHLKENLPRHFSFVKNLVHHGLKDVTITGTCLEYGMQEGGLSENMECRPDNPYAEAKHRLQMQLQHLSTQHEISFKWLRLFYMYGKGQNSGSLIPLLEKALTNGEVFFNMSGGEQTRDFLPVEKMAEYIVTAALQKEVEGIINICSGIPVTVKDFVRKYLAAQKKTIELNFGYYPYPDYEPMHFWGNDAKFKLIKG